MCYVSFVRKVEEVVIMFQVKKIKMYDYDV